MTTKASGVAALLIPILLFAAAGRADELLYPLPLPPAISSKFGEARHDHPHAGVDCWTYLQLDVPVLAVADGSVFEVKSSEAGYGRVIYQRLADGRIAVYAHLSAFAPKLTSERGRFARMWLGPRAIPVARGEVIGYSGDAGTDVPHLHFELRDANGRPINPLKAGLVVRDTLPPVFEAIHLEPLTALAQAAGRSRDVIVPLRKGDDGVYRGGPVTVAGEIGLSALAYDLMDDNPRRLAPYELRLAIDGRETFLNRFDTADYGKRFTAALIYDQRLLGDGQGAFIRLYRLHERTIFHAADGDGVLRLPPGAHLAAITATDEAGNAARAEIVLNVAPADAAQAPTARVRRAATAAKITAVLDPRIEWTPGFARITGEGGLLNGQPPQVGVAVGPSGRPIPASKWRARLIDGEFELALPLPKEPAGEVRVSLVWATPGDVTNRQTLVFPYRMAVAGKAVVSPDEQAKLEIPAGALFRDVPLSVETCAPPTPEGLEMVGRAYRFGPGYEPLRQKLHIEIKPPKGAPTDHMGVYLYDRGKWWPLGAGGAANTPLFGTFALLRDTEPPQFGATLVGPGDAPTVKFIAWDRGSGLYNGGIALKLDGVVQPFDYLPLKSQIEWHASDRLSPGDHVLSLRVCDGAGNCANKLQALPIR